MPPPFALMLSVWDPSLAVVTTFTPLRNTSTLAAEVPVQVRSTSFWLLTLRPTAESDSPVDARVVAESVFEYGELPPALCARTR